MGCSGWRLRPHRRAWRSGELLVHLNPVQQLRDGTAAPSGRRNGAGAVALLSGNIDPGEEPQGRSPSMSAPKNSVGIWAFGLDEDFEAEVVRRRQRSRAARSEERQP